MTTTEIPNGGAEATTEGAEATTEVSSNADTKRAGSSTGPGMSRKKIIILGGSIACVIISGLAIGAGVYFATRPENIEVTTSTAKETLPTTVKAARISGSPNGVVTIDYTNLLSDPLVFSYYLNIENFNFTEFALSGESLQNLAVYVTRSDQSTVQDLGRDPISIQNIVDQELPYPLQDGFLPGDYNGVIFAVVRDSSINVFSNLDPVTSSAFDLIVNPDQNIATPTALPSVSPSLVPSVSPSLVPSASPSLVPSSSPSLEPTKRPSSLPSREPTMAPSSSPSENPTIAPTSSPSEDPTMAPTSSPSEGPTIAPTFSPSKSPTVAPSLSPSRAPTIAPTAPTTSPSGTPSISPTVSPAPSGTDTPSSTPSQMPSFLPTTSISPSYTPTLTPTKSPTYSPSLAPTNSPTRAPTKSPTRSPTQAPTQTPTQAPTPNPTQAPTQAPTPNPTQAPTQAPTPNPTQAPTQAPTPNPTKSPTSAPTKSPTSAPTKNPTRAPTPPPTIVPPPPALTSSLSGEYSIGGTLTIDYRNDLVNGQIQAVPILRFDIPRLASAPGPFLYLSKRPFSETRGGRLTSDEIFIPVDSGDKGSFSVQGTFEQILDEIGNVQDLSDYQNGSWVVWCRPFSVWIGGGAIETV